MEFVSLGPADTLEVQWPVGVTAELPDFIGVGACRCGTTFWWNVLTQHPDIDIPHRFSNLLQRQHPIWIKERHWFDRFAYWQPTSIEKLKLSYASIFPRNTGTITGEWTPHYLEQWWTPRLIAEIAPDAKILLLLRDPIDRYVSEVTQLQNGPTQSSLSFQRGLYAKQLEWLLEWIPREKILVLQFEQIINVPFKMAEKTFEFLGLDSVFVPSFDVPTNGTVHPKIKPWHSDMLRKMYSKDVNKLAKLLGADFNFWENFK